MAPRIAHHAVWGVWVAVACMVAGCSQPRDAAEPEIVQVPPPPSVAPAPPAPPTVAQCDATTQTAIQQVIESQSTALGAQDFELAYTFASPAFRAGVTLEMFERVITRQYDMLIYFEGAVFGPCEIIADGIAQMNVEVQSTVYRPVAMVYEMVFVEDQWWVSAVDNPVSAIPNA
jgi:hypothetical protein